MVKAASPIRLQEDLVKAATLKAKSFHRSTAEQIEYWADLGRSVASTLDPDVLLSLTSGLVTINVEPVYSAPIDPDDVFQSLEAERETGNLPNNITSSTVRYQASLEHPGYLEQIDQNNEIHIGRFVNGEFTPLNETLN